MRSNRLGDSKAFGAGYAHDVRNESDLPALSLHVALLVDIRPAAQRELEGEVAPSAASQPGVRKGCPFPA